MIAIPHILIGALLASKMSYLPLALLLALLSHYILDALPHWEYKVDKIMKGEWKKGLSQLLKVTVDAGFGILLVYLLSDNFKIALLGSFFAVLPDIVMVLNTKARSRILSRIEMPHKKSHIPKNKTSPSWEVSIESALTLLVILLFLLL